MGEKLRIFGENNAFYCVLYKGIPKGLYKNYIYYIM